MQTPPKQNSVCIVPFAPVRPTRNTYGLGIHRRINLLPIFNTQTTEAFLVSDSIVPSHTISTLNEYNDAVVPF